MRPILESAGGGGRDECVGADGLIDPSLFACRAIDLQPSRVELAAEELTRLGEAVRWEMTGIAADWAGLRPWYVAPEQERLLALMDAPADDARDLADAIRRAAGLLTTYAGELVPIQRTLADLERRAQQFRDEVRDGVLVPISESKRPTVLQSVLGLIAGSVPMTLVPWFHDAQAVERNRELLAEYATILARLSAAADECENGILALLVDPSTAEDTDPVPAEAFDPSYVQMPWGWPVEEDRNVVESIGEGGRRIVQGLIETALPMLGVDPQTGRHDTGLAVQSWLGMGNTLGSAAITLMLPPDRLGRTPPLWHGWLQQRYQLAAGLGLAVGIDAAAADHGASVFHAWDDDPIATGIESVGNVVLMLVPGAGAARFAGLSARASRWARITAAGADFVIPGGSFAVAGSVRVVSNLADAAQLSGRVTGLRLHPAGVVDVLTDSFRHTPVSDELFGPTTGGAPQRGRHS